MKISSIFLLFVLIASTSSQTQNQSQPQSQTQPQNQSQPLNQTQDQNKTNQTKNATNQTQSPQPTIQLQQNNQSKTNTTTSCNVTNCVTCSSNNYCQNCGNYILLPNHTCSVCPDPNNQAPCKCDSSCVGCLQDPIDSQIKCLNCKNQTQSINGSKCIDQCPSNFVGLYMVLNQTNFLIPYPGYYDESARGEDPANMTIEYHCLQSCPNGTLIAVDSYFEWYCSPACQSYEQQLQNVCVPNICDLGYFQNFTLLTKTYQTFLPISYKNIDALTSQLQVLNKTDCFACSMNCLYCDNPKTCLECNEYSDLNIQGGCDLNCQPWEVPYNVTFNQQQCSFCKDNCNTCPQELIIYDNNCVYECPQKYLNVQRRCKAQLTSSIWLQGYGSRLQYMSSQKIIKLNYLFVLQPNTTTEIEQIECSVTNILNPSQNHTFFFDFFSQPKIIHNQYQKVYYEFDSGTFPPGTDILISCQSNVQVTNQGVSKTYKQNTTAFTSTLPLPNGTLSIFASGNYSIQLSLDDFSPLFGLSEEEFVEERNYELQDQNEYIIPPLYRNMQYLPFLVTLYANYQSELFEVWSQLTYKPFRNFNTKVFLNQFYNNTQLTFTLMVSNEWITSYFYSPLKFTVIDSETAQYEYTRSLAILKSLGSSQLQIEKCLKSLMIYSLSLNSIQANSCVCQNQGQCVGNVCTCPPNFVGTLCELDRATTLKNILGVYSAIIGMQESSQSEGTIYSISFTTTQLSGINAMGDQTLVNSQIAIVRLLVKSQDLLNIRSANNMIRICSHTEEQMDIIYTNSSDYSSSPNLNNSSSSSSSSSSSRILQSNNTSNTSNSSTPSLTIAQQNQYLIEALFQKVLIINHKIMLRQNQLYQMITHDNLTVVLTVLNLTNNVPQQSVSLNGVKFNVDQKSVISLLNNANSDQPAIFLLVRQLSGYQQMQYNGQYFIENSAYVQVNISQPNTYFPMFRNTTNSTFNSSPISLTFPNTYQGSTCLYYDKITKTWITDTMTTLGSTTFTQCSTYHLTNFALGLSYQGGEEDEAYETDHNQKIGSINIIVVLMIYLVLSVIVCVVRRSKSVQDQKSPGQDNFDQVPQNDNNDEKQFPIMVAPVNVGSQQQLGGNQQYITPTNDEKQAGVYIPSVASMNKLSSAGSGVIHDNESPSKGHATKTNTNYDSLKSRRLYNFVLCLFPYPNTWIPSQHRLSIIFLWFTCYQFLFAIIVSSNTDESNLLGVILLTLFVSNVFNYIYAGIALGVSKCAPSCKYVAVTSLINLIIFIHLIIVYAMYTQSDSQKLGQDHFVNSLFQIIVNLGLFDFLMELISKYPGVGFLRRMRSFKLMEYLDE